MEEKSAFVKQVANEEASAQVQIWEHAFGFIPMGVVKCAIDLKIPDILERHGGKMTHSDLSTALGCSPAILHRIMRYLISRGFFKLQSYQESTSSSICYVQTPLSRSLMKNGERGIGPFILWLSSTAMVDPLQKLSQHVLEGGDSPFKATHGVDLYEYSAENPSQSQLFHEAMACRSRLVVSAIIELYPELFKGVKSVVDVGGSDGTTLQMLVKAFPWIHGINFDLPNVVSMAPRWDGIEIVAGNMFERIPNADAVLIKRVLSGCTDEECIQILINCREAILKSGGKVVIVDVVVRGDEDEYNNMHLALDMLVLAYTEKGKERTIKEWENVIKAAGFSRLNVKDIQTIVSVIEAHP